MCGFGLVTTDNPTLRNFATAKLDRQDADKLDPTKAPTLRLTDDPTSSEDENRDSNFEIAGGATAAPNDQTLMLSLIHI